MKKLLAVAAAAAAGVVAWRRWQDAEAEKKKWHQATDTID
ncbi:DLW-39 family protein [Tersicoccus phoenicis]|nr:DLW-39 family protein [Tersicoccus phoenicis]